jgi:hypothetical protein
MSQTDRNLASEQTGPELKISVRLFDDVERKRVEQNIRIYNKKNGDVWQLSPANEAQVIVFSLDEPGGELFFNSCQQTRKIIPVVYGTENHSDCAWHINPVKGAQSCLSVLSSLQTALAEKEKPTSYVEDISIKILENLITKIKMSPFSHIQYNSLLSIYVSNESNTITVTLPSISNLCLSNLSSLLSRIDIKDIKVNEINENDYRTNAHTQHSLFPLDQFFWSLVTLHPNYGLFSQLEGRRFHIETWPPFTLLSHSYDHILIAALLKRYCVDLDTIFTRLNVPAEAVYTFINASMAMDNLSTPSDEIQINFSKATELIPKKKTLMKKILNRLAKTEVE